MAANPMGNKRGHPEAHFSRDQEAMAYGLVLQGVAYEKIAASMGVTVKTLKKHLGATLDEAKRQCIARVSGSLYRAALLAQEAPHGVAAAKFFLGSQAGWMEKNNVQLTGADGGAITQRLIVDFNGGNDSGTTDQVSAETRTAFEAGEV